MNHYPHHIGDFNNATRHLTRIERSIYRDLLDLYYDTERAIPAETQWVCRRLLAVTQEERDAVSLVLGEFFTLIDGAYQNERCDAEIAAYHERRERAKANGSKGGRPPKGEITQPVISGKAKRNPKKANQNQNQNQEGSTGVDPTAADRVGELFEEFWQAYPRKEGKANALKAFSKALPLSADGTRGIIAGVLRAKTSEQWLRDGGAYIPHPATWLNGRRWEDQIHVTGTQSHGQRAPAASLLDRVSSANAPAAPAGGRVFDQAAGDGHVLGAVR